MFNSRKIFSLVMLVFIGLAANAQLKQPNIIFLLTDDLGYGDIGCYGQQKVATPNIDQLAKEGLKATQFYSGSAVCAPARATLLMGQHTGHTPIRGNKTLKPEGQIPLPDSAITFPMLLQKNGYSTAAFGKWSMGFIASTGAPSKKGFDMFYGYNCQTLAHNYYPDHLWENDKKIEFTNNPEEHTAYSADLIHAKALQYLEQQGSKPFFMYLPYTLPHGDLSIPHDSTYEFYVKKFNEAPLPKPANYIAKEGKWFEPYPHAAFAAMMARLDRYVGEINAMLKKKGMEENTLFIFTSDNGPHKEDGGDPEFFNSNGEWRGIKRDVYEGGIREPFIAKWKGKIAAGSTTNYAFAMWDMFPTFLSMAHIRNTQKADGFSVVPTLLNKPQAQHEFLYWELAEAGSKQAVRFGDWKAVRLNVLTEKEPPIELYNLKNDPQENNNVAASNPAIVAKLKRIMENEHTENKEWPLLVKEVKP